MALEPYELELEVIPGPGTQIHDWETMRQKIELVKPFAKTVHIDIVDGKFTANNNLIDPAPFAAYTKDMLFEVHLMTENPIQYLESWAKAGFKRFIGQIEKMPDIPAFVAKAEQLGEVGLAIDGPTPLSALNDEFLEDVDVIHIYTSDQAGFSNKPFDPSRLEKVKALRAKAAYLPIEIDGGVNDKTIVDAKQAGATRFVTTGFLFGSTNSATQFALLEKSLGL